MFIVNTKADIKLACCTSDILVEALDLGRVRSAGFPDMANCFAEGDGLENATAGIMATFKMTIRDFYEEPCEELPPTGFHYVWVS